MTPHTDGQNTKEAMFRHVPCVRVDGEKAEVANHEVIEELPYALFINGRHAMTAMMSSTVRAASEAGSNFIALFPRLRHRGQKHNQRPTPFADNADVLARPQSTGASGVFARR